MANEEGTIDPENEPKQCECKYNSKKSNTKAYAAAAVGGVGLLSVATYGILGLGFGPAGIAAGSIASSMMSAATSYGIGGAVVAAGQSAGAAGLAVTTKAVIVGAGAAVGYKVGGSGGQCECGKASPTGVDGGSGKTECEKEPTPTANGDSDRDSV